MKSCWTFLRAEWDRVIGVALIIAGGVALFLGYRGVADSPFVSVQLPYVISGGFGGIVLCGAGVALLVMADLHDEWRKLDRIEAAILGHWMNPPLDAPAAPEATPPTTAVDHRRASLGAGLVLGLVVLAAAWERAAGSSQPHVGYQGVAVGSVGVTLMLAVAAVVVLGKRSEVARRRAGLLGEWLTSRKVLPPVESESPDVLIASASRRFHRAQCPVLADLEPAAVRRDAVPTNLEPCGICGAT